MTRTGRLEKYATSSSANDAVVRLLAMRGEPILSSPICGAKHL